MSVRLTDTDNVALYDSVTGWAFGPTFPSELAALDFLEFTSKSPDLRTIGNRELEQLYTGWLAQRGSQFRLELGTDVSRETRRYRLSCGYLLSVTERLQVGVPVQCPDCGKTGIITGKVTP